MSTEQKNKKQNEVRGDEGGAAGKQVVGQQRKRAHK